MLEELSKLMRAEATPERAKASAWYFKTGPGQYGEGDVFIGLTLPQMHKIARQYSGLSLDDIEALLKSPIHEERQVALLILVHQYKKAGRKGKKQIASFYHKHRDRVNNWDLVDGSAPQILGDYLLDHSRAVLYRLAKSKSLWDRRIALIATFAFIKKGQTEDSFKLAEILIADREDLIQKALGWMLREIGKKCGREILEGFLKDHYHLMGRTALRYAIEHLEPERRQEYLKGVI